jgi:hypothetical protein
MRRRGDKPSFTNLNAFGQSFAEISAQIEKTFVRSSLDGVILKLYRRTGEIVSKLPPTLLPSHWKPVARSAEA